MLMILPMNQSGSPIQPQIPFLEFPPGLANLWLPGKERGRYGMQLQLRMRINAIE